MRHLLAYTRRDTDSEAGYVLLAVIVIASMLLISLAVTAPRVALSIRREKELEAIHRGEQYQRAIQLYYRRFGHYPTSIDQLLNTNQIRFLRKRYTDPLTGKDDWKTVLFGRAHVRPLGFFGQPLIVVAGISPMAGSMYAAPAAVTDAHGVPVAGNEASEDGNSADSGPDSGGLTQNSSAADTGSSANSAESAGSDNEANSSGGFGPSATTFNTGGPIVGVTLPINRPSLLDYKLQSRYSQWEFNYDPTVDLAMKGMMPSNPAAPAPGTPTNGAPGFTPPSAGTPMPTPNPQPQ